MTDRSVTLDEQEWQVILAIVSNAPWRQANPLLMKIGEQLRMISQPDPRMQMRAGNAGNVMNDGAPV